MDQEKNEVSGRQITAARGLLGLSLEELARIVGLTPTALSRIEHGKAVPRKSTLETIRRALEQRGIEFASGEKTCVCLDRSKAIIPTP